MNPAHLPDIPRGVNPLQSAALRLALNEMFARAVTRVEGADLLLVRGLPAIPKGLMVLGQSYLDALENIAVRGLIRVHGDGIWCDGTEGKIENQMEPIEAGMHLLQVHEVIRRNLERWVTEVVPQDDSLVVDTPGWGHRYVEVLSSADPAGQDDDDPPPQKYDSIGGAWSSGIVGSYSSEVAISGSSDPGSVPQSGSSDPGSVPSSGSSDPGSLPSSGSSDPGSTPQSGSSDPGSVPTSEGAGSSSSSEPAVPCTCPCWPPACTDATTGASLAQEYDVTATFVFWQDDDGDGNLTRVCSWTETVRVTYDASTSCLWWGWSTYDYTSCSDTGSAFAGVSLNLTTPSSGECYWYARHEDSIGDNEAKKHTGYTPEGAYDDSTHPSDQSFPAYAYHVRMTNVSVAEVV